MNSGQAATSSPGPFAWCFQVLALLRDIKRARARFVDAVLVELLHAEVVEQAAEFEEMRAALRHWVAKLPQSSRALVEGRYFQKLAIQAIAEETERNLSAVKVALKSDELQTLYHQTKL